MTNRRKIAKILARVGLSISNFGLWIMRQSGALYDAEISMLDRRIEKLEAMRRR